MNLWVRLVMVWLGSYFRPRLSPIDPSRLRFTVWPHDLDTNRHMNNGRYWTMMDLGRFDLILRTGLGSIVFRRGWSPLVASGTIRFRRAVTLFDRYTLETRVLCWDEKYIFLEQRFERGADLVAVGVVKTLFRDRHGNIRPTDVLGAVGISIPSPPMPEWIRIWQEAETRSQGT